MLLGCSWCLGWARDLAPLRKALPRPVTKFPAGYGKNALQGNTVVFSPPEYGACVQRRPAGSGLPVDAIGQLKVTEGLMNPNTAYWENFGLSGSNRAFRFPFYGNEYGMFWVSTKGFVSLCNEGGKLSDSSLVIDVLRLGGDKSFWPRKAYEVWWKQLPDRAVITFQGVALYGDSSRQRKVYSETKMNTFQVELFVNGTIAIHYEAINVVSAFQVGLRPEEWRLKKEIEWWPDSAEAPWCESKPAIEQGPVSEGAVGLGHWFEPSAGKESLEDMTVVFSPPEYEPCLVQRPWRSLLPWSGAGRKFAIMSTDVATENSAHLIDFQLGFKFPFYGREYPRFWIGMQGFISLTNSTDNNWALLVGKLPQITIARLADGHSWYMDNKLDVWWLQLEDRAIITFGSVSYYYEEAREQLHAPSTAQHLRDFTSSFQAELFRNGTIALHYQIINATVPFHVGLRPEPVATDALDWWDSGDEQVLCSLESDPSPSEDPRCCPNIKTQLIEAIESQLHKCFKAEAV